MTLGIGFKYLISICVLAVILFTEPLYRTSFFELSFTYIPSIQAGASSTLKGFWGGYSDMGLTFITAAPTLVCFLMAD